MSSGKTPFSYYQTQIKHSSPAVFINYLFLNILILNHKLKHTHSSDSKHFFCLWRFLTDWNDLEMAAVIRAGRIP